MWVRIIQGRIRYLLLPYEMPLEGKPHSAASRFSQSHPPTSQLGRG